MTRKRIKKNAFKRTAMKKPKKKDAPSLLLDDQPLTDTVTQENEIEIVNGNIVSDSEKYIVIDDVDEIVQIEEEANDEKADNHSSLGSEITGNESTNKQESLVEIVAKSVTSVHAPLPSNSIDVVSPVKFLKGRKFVSHGDLFVPVLQDAGYEPHGLTGLHNLGNTCYINASIAALSNCPPFTEFFRSAASLAPFASKSFDDGTEPPVSRALRRLIQSLWAEERCGAINPFLFIQQIRRHCPQFRTLAQQDAQEFIRCLLDLLHRELRQPVFSWEHRSSMSLHDCSAKNSEQTSQDVRRESGSSRSSSRTSADDELYETADSGWSSDAENAALSSDSKRLKMKSLVKTNEELHCTNTDESKEDGGVNRSFAEENCISTSPVCYRSIVTEAFDGVLRSVVKCLTCQHLSETFETFQDLSLSIPTRAQLEHLAQSEGAEEDTRSLLEESNESSYWWPWWLGGGWLRALYRFLFGDFVSVKEALTAFFSPDDLRGENMYSCEKCGKLRNGVKTCKIARLPEILCIHLKRFRHDLTYSTKVRTRVTFPLDDLNLSPFVISGSEEHCYYDLCAIITHRGNSAESGHYVACCKNEEDHQWYEYDDANVTHIEIADVMTREAYVLFYQRRTSLSLEIIRSKIMDFLVEKCETNRTKLKVPVHYYISREWMHRFATFSHPGPITNHDFLCPHSQILPRRAENIADYYATISSSMWDYLHEHFGGGPVSNELHYCLICQNEYQHLKHKRETEMRACMVLENQYRSMKSVFPAATYGHHLPPNAISKQWYDKWKAFVNGETLEPPGKIDNSSLLYRSPKDSMYRIRPTSFVPLPRELWLFLLSCYGGGPEILCVADLHPTDDMLKDWIGLADKNIAEATGTIGKLREMGSVSPLSSKITEPDESSVPEIPSPTERVLYPVMQQVD